MNISETHFLLLFGIARFSSQEIKNNHCDSVHNYFFDFSCVSTILWLSLGISSRQFTPLVTCTKLSPSSTRGWHKKKAARKGRPFYWLRSNCLLHNLLSFSYIPEMSQQASFLLPPFLSLFLPCLILLSLPSFLCAQFYLTFNPVFSFLCCNSYFFFIYF